MRGEKREGLEEEGEGERRKLFVHWHVLGAGVWNTPLGIYRLGCMIGIAFEVETDELIINTVCFF